MSKLSLLLFLAALVTRSEAGMARVRFGGLSCGQRVHQATLGLSPVTALREAQIAGYLDRSMSFFDLGKRFRTLSQGLYRNTYPDLTTIADLLEAAEQSHLGSQSAFVVGIRHTWLRAVERPIASWDVRAFYEPEASVYKPTGFIEFIITHTDGSKSHVYSFREGRYRPTDERDHRPIVNLFVLSNGADEVATTLKCTEGDHHTGDGLIITPLETGPSLAEIIAIRSRMIEKVRRDEARVEPEAVGG